MHDSDLPTSLMRALRILSKRTRILVHMKTILHDVPPPQGQLFGALPPAGASAPAIAIAAVDDGTGTRIQLIHPTL